MANQRIYISISPGDRAITERIAGDLRQALGDRDSVWYDTTGDRAQALAELAARPIFLVVLSMNAVVAPTVNDDISHAISQAQIPPGKMIIPVIVAPCPVREDLRARRSVSFIPPIMYDVALRELLSALGFTAQAQGWEARPAQPAPYPQPGYAPLQPPAYAAPFAQPIPNAPYAEQTPEAAPKRSATVPLAASLLLIVVLGILGWYFLPIHGGTTHPVGGAPSANTATPNPNQGNTEFIIGSDLPVSANDAVIGIPTQNGVQLAIEQNADLGHGYHLTWLGKDDVSTTTGKHDPTVGATNMVAFADNPAVMGVVGAFNSGVSAAEMPVAAQAGLVMISPSNTNVGLTMQQYAAMNGFNWDQIHPPGKPEAYFRIIGNDQAQGKLLATVALGPTAQGGFGYTKAFVVDDSEIYGKGLADFFSQFFIAGGGQIVGTRASIDEQHTSAFSTLAHQIVAAHPQFVFYGGVTWGGGCLLKKAIAQAGGASILMLGGDGITQDPQCTQDAGAYANTIYGSFAGPELGALPNATSFIQAYRQRFGQDPISYSALAYDAAMIEITAIKNLIANNQPVTRANVLAQAQSIAYDGVTGHIAFDSHGDNAGAKPYSIWKDDSANWSFVQNVTIQ